LKLQIKEESMKKGVYVLVMLAVLSTMAEVGWGQIAAWDFYGETSPDNSTADVYNANMDASNLITRGAGAAASLGSNSFRTTGFKNDGISTSNTDYFQITLSASSGYTLSLSTIDAKFNGTQTFVGTDGVTSQFAYSLDGTNFTLIGSSFVLTGTVPLTMSQIDLSGISDLQNISSATTITIRYYASGQTTTGGWGFYSSSSGSYGLAIGGSIDAVAGTPIINISESSLSGFSYEVGSGPSAEQTFTVSGTNLTADISISAPEHFEISKTSGSDFTSSLTFAQSDGSVNETIIYARLKAGLATGSYSSENITCSCEGADDRIITCSGTVTSPPMHYRSKITGNWGDNSTWESSTDQTTWSNASLSPTSNDYTITIQNGHTITIDASVTADQILVESGGQLSIASGQILTLNDGTETDLDINGTVLNSGTLIIGTNATWAVNSDGTYIHNTTSGISTPLNSATLDAASNFIYRGSSSLKPAVSVSGRKYGNLIFQSSSGIYEQSIPGGSALTINGNLTINENVSLNSSMTGLINIMGNFINNGTYSANSTQIISFQGTSAQSISGSSTTTFYGLTLNNSSGLTLNVSAVVSDTLALTSGNIITGSNTLTLGTSDSSCGNLTRTSGTVIGNFERWFTTGANSNFLFPVGTESHYRPVTISTTNIEAGGKILVSHTDGSGGTNLSSTLEDGEYIINRRSNMYWTLTGDSISGGTYDLSIDANGQEGISSLTKIRLINSSDGNTFSLVGTHSGGSGTVFNRTEITVGTFDHFYLGSNMADNSLPVSLTSFSAQSRNQSVVLSWTTESEIENLGFIIQKRLPKSGNWLLVADYTTCEALVGHGSTSEAHEYSYTDAAVVPGATYSYRLGDVDYKGKVTWHKEVEVKVEAENAQVPLVFGLKPAYPNPFNPSVTIPYSLAEDGQMSLKIYNLRGQLVETLVSAYALKGAYSINWQPVNLSAGVYLVRLESGKKTNMQKVIFVK
jgi:hypothetical protein